MFLCLVHNVTQPVKLEDGEPCTNDTINCSHHSVVKLIFDQHVIHVYPEKVIDVSVELNMFNCSRDAHRSNTTTDMLVHNTTSHVRPQHNAENYEGTREGDPDCCQKIWGFVCKVLDSVVFIKEYEQAEEDGAHFTPTQKVSTVDVQIRTAR